MWSSRLFLKLFLTYAVLIVLTVSTCLAIVAGRQEDQLFEQVRRRLQDSATLLSNNVKEELTDADVEKLQSQIRALGAQTKTRFTLVDATGKVLADSEQQTVAAVEAMDNHLSREEFIQAQHSGSGSSRRLSPTLDIPYLYYALKVDGEDDVVGFVRAAQPIASILSEVTAVRQLIALAGIGVGVAGLLVTYWLTRRIVQPIHKLTVAAEEMAIGREPRRMGITSKDEVGILSRAFERMVDRLRRRENALHESVDRQSTILTSMHEGVLALDAKQQVLFANSAAGNMLGFVPDQVENRNLLEVVDCDDLYEIAQRAIATEMLAESEMEWTSDTLRTLDVNATPLPGDPSPGVVLVLHDVTEIKRLEGLRQQFVANVSHELKTPLSSIKAYTETLINGALEDADNARRFLSRIDDQSDRLHQLIIDMLALARIESGQAAIERTAVRLVDVVDSCLSNCEARATSGEVSVLTELDNDETELYANEESLLQILNNLVDNAIKYTPSGGTITIRSREQNNQAVIEVTDTGPGIDPVHHERLFERFYRVDKARSRELGGTGLGLAIVKHLCNAMDGAVTVDSTPGKGSTFRVVLPLMVSQPTNV